MYDGFCSATPHWFVSHLKYIHRYQGESFSHIYFLDEKTSYHSRHSQLYKTNDSAKTWSLLQDNDIYTIQAIWFIDARTGFVADDNGLKRTSDSGRTWTVLPINYIGYNDRDILALKFLNSKVGYFTSAYGGIHQTIDSGKTWIPYSRTPYDSRYITFTKDSLVYFGSANGTIVSGKIDTAFGVKAGCVSGTFSFTSNITGPTYQWEVNTGLGTYAPITDNAFYAGAST